MESSSTNHTVDGSTRQRWNIYRRYLQTKILFRSRVDSRGGWFGTPSEGQLDTLTVLINRGSGKQFLLVSSASAHIMPAEILPVYTTPKIKPLLNRYERMTKRKSNPDPNITLDCSKRWE